MEESEEIGVGLRISHCRAEEVGMGLGSVIVELRKSV